MAIENGAFDAYWRAYWRGVSAEADATFIPCGASHRFGDLMTSESASQASTLCCLFLWFVEIYCRWIQKWGRGCKGDKKIGAFRNSAAHSFLCTSPILWTRSAFFSPSFFCQVVIVHLRARFISLPLSCTLFSGSLLTCSARPLRPGWDVQQGQGGRQLLDAGGWQGGQHRAAKGTPNARSVERVGLCSVASGPGRGRHKENAWKMRRCVGRDKKSAVCCRHVVGISSNGTVVRSRRVMICLRRSSQVIYADFAEFRRGFSRSPIRAWWVRLFLITRETPKPCVVFPTKARVCTFHACIFSKRTVLGTVLWNRRKTTSAVLLSCLTPSPGLCSAGEPDGVVEVRSQGRPGDQHG